MRAIVSTVRRVIYKQFVCRTVLLSGMALTPGDVNALDPLYISDLIDVSCLKMQSIPCPPYRLSPSQDEIPDIVLSCRDGSPMLYGTSPPRHSNSAEAWVTVTPLPRLVVVGVASSCSSRLQPQHQPESWSRSTQSPEGRRAVIMWNRNNLVRKAGKNRTRTQCVDILILWKNFPLNLDYST